ncbi:hypothetical protein ACEXQD_04255 [Herbiconiux sp. P15]|uniref:hypothetical protein n=1 Tax=Herbiconiux liukaitaii TaxID=3342799 RepID=UPI0035BB5491
MDTEAAGGAGADASEMVGDPEQVARAARSKRRRRAAVTVGTVALVAGLGAGGLALVLGGASAGGGDAAAATSVAVTSTPGPSSSPPPTPAPAPEPEAAIAPVRVPLECDSLLPESTAEGLAGVDLVAVAPSGPDPLSFADARAGALSCGWFAPGSTEGAVAPGSAVLTIVPDVSPEDYEDTSRGIDLGPYPPIPGYSADSREACTVGASFPFCSLIERIGDYGVQLSMTPGSQVITEADVAAMRDRFAVVAEAVSGAGADAPLWQPEGSNLVGVSRCDGLITAEQLGTIVGDPTVDQYRSAEGEFRIATFRSNAQVGGFACGWMGEGAGIWASVLPGGSGYFAGSAPLQGGVWNPVTADAASAYPGEAYVSDAGDEASVLVDNAWFLVRVPAEMAGDLPAIMGAVVANVTAAG